MKLAHSSAPVLFLLLTALSTFAGCSETAEDAATDETDLKKKIKPDGGISSALTRFELTKPSWVSKAAFVGSYSFKNGGMAPGDIQEFDVRAGGEPVSGAFRLIGREVFIDEPLSITPGTSVVRKPSGLYVHFAEPLTDLSSDWNLNGNSSGEAWFVSPGQHTITTRYEQNPLVANVTEGRLTEVVRPITRVQIKLDAYDAAYPGTGDTYSITEGRSVQLRKPDGSPAYASDYIIAHTALFPIDLRFTPANHIQLFTRPTVENGTVKIVFNRLEIDDIEVTINGVKKMQKGSAEIHAGPTSISPWLTSVPTHTGIDLPNGTYTVVSHTDTPYGQVLHTETVTFP